MLFLAFILNLAALICGVWCVIDATTSIRRAFIASSFDWDMETASLCRFLTVLIVGFALSIIAAQLAKVAG